MYRVFVHVVEKVCNCLLVTWNKLNGKNRKDHDKCDPIMTS